MLPPHILTYDCGLTAGQFPKFEDDVYRVNAEDDAFRFLLPTAETALINLYRGEILEEKRPAQAACLPTRPATAARPAPTAPASAA